MVIGEARFGDLTKRRSRRHLICTKTGWDMDTLVQEGFRSKVEKLRVGGILGAEYVVQSILGQLFLNKISKEKAVGAMCD